jgi:hypothetical protein
VWEGLQVGYDNHPLFNRATPSKTRQRRARRGRGDKFAFSPVRIFTNIAANAFVLPAAEGYRLCPACDRYVCRNNLHCDACGKCTSKVCVVCLVCVVCRALTVPVLRRRTGGSGVTATRAGCACHRVACTAPLAGDATCRSTSTPRPYDTRARVRLRV